MSLAMARTFVVGFGLEVGGICAMCLWQDTEAIAAPLALVGAGMMAYAVLFGK